MNEHGLAVRVVIPTRNRVDSLWRTLASLARQTFPVDQFEVVVVDDGSQDSTARLTANFAAPFRLTVRTAERPAGAAAARNLGAAGAATPLLLFLDDDIEAAPGLVEAHVRAHAAGAQVTIGYLPVAVSVGRGFFPIALRGWWESMFASMRQPGHRYTFRDLLTGNCAIAAELFHGTGGFDPSLACHEDYELGVRLIECEARFQFVEKARGLHHERTTLQRALDRKRAEGRADVQILSRHPHLWPVLPMGFLEERSGRRQRALRRLALSAPPGSRLAERGLRAGLRLHEAIRRRGRWGVTLDHVLGLAYWQGVSAAAGGHEGFRELRARAAAERPSPHDELEVDVAAGLADGMRRVDEQRPPALTVRYRGELVGRLPAMPGAEALRGIHLQSALARDLSPGFLRALGRIGAARLEFRHRPIATGPLPAAELNL